MAPSFRILIKRYCVLKPIRAFAGYFALIATILSLSLTGGATEITEYQVTTPGSNLRDITPGPDGNLWFTELGGHKVGRITTAGVITEFSLGITSTPFSIVSGPDNNLWVTDSGQNTIVRITPGGSVTRFPVPTRSSGLTDITVGPDGNLWFTELLASKIGRISTTGVVVEFSLPAQTEPFGITAGADGNIWFTESRANKIGRITPDGTVTEFPVPTAGSRPREISIGPDGNVWFTEFYGSKIGRITPSGGITEFTIPWAHSRPDGITIGKDGNVWFTQSRSSRFCRITPAGQITEFKLRQAGRAPAGIALGSDGNLWIVQRGGSTIARVVLPEALPPLTYLETSGHTMGVTVAADGVIWFTQKNPQGIGRIASNSEVTYFTLPSSIGNKSLTEALTTGPQGELWFGLSSADASYVGRMTSAGAFTEFTISAPNPATRFSVRDLVAGPDGNIWLTEFWTGYSIGKIVRVTPSGTVSKFDIPRNSAAAFGITAGPDGNLWFGAGERVSRITTTGSITEFSPPTTHRGPRDITVGPDGNLWFTTFSKRVGKVTTEGDITEFRLSSSSEDPRDIVLGPDSNLWVIQANGHVGKITPLGTLTSFSVPNVTNISGIAAGPNGNILLTAGNKNIVSLNLNDPFILEPIADGFIVQENAGGNFGFAEYLETRLAPNNDSGRDRETYLMFDLSQVLTVKSARLRFFGQLHAATPPGSSATTKTAILPLPNMTWKEGTLTWANRPSPMSAVSSTVISVKGGEPRWYEVDVTSHFRSAKAAGRNLTGIVLRNITTGATADQYTRFNSRQASSNRPQLLITR